MFHRHKWERVGYKKFSDLTRMFLLVDAYGTEELRCVKCDARGERLDSGGEVHWWSFGSGYYRARVVK